ncbi:MAG: NUDIX hydrolase [Prosthecochloris sp.]|uniref:NUDIX hydrolase n=1 Tax=Prosthecochloris aestuarii (strain DSM 271 / SK 413) TaxID=290512 RepID=B4S719_PROA2|nr:MULTISPECIES: NUDIX hydrolase [Prosthecochloris]ACF45856.1 NUDIX hydrolase [Prosthecochloris aestuarii DSM 271]MCW8798104.1 NUDIX hydrolase [Prosthecochloris sp.]NEX11422.1 NUDIX domain-containing protein [Prosthecochloris sp.]RDD30635.1 NUDIX domain-containing protein [Prosthecochloris sp. ZM]
MSSKRQWLYRQSGVIPVFEDSIVLITTRRSKRWIIPKGVVEKGMTPPDSAAKEAFEEAGLIGSVHDFQIGTFRYRKWGGTCTVQVYPLFVEQVLDEWEEMHMRKRKVVSVREAVKMVQHEELSRIISGFFRHVKGS